MTKRISILALAFFLPFCTASASDINSGQNASIKSNQADTGFSMEAWQTTVTRSGAKQAYRSKPRSIGKKRSNIAVLRAEALQISMKHLPRLRPYASNYPRMVSVVRAYWRKHAANPNASRLTNMIMQHVQEKYRFFVRPKLHSGIARGINVLKNKLRKS